MFESSDKPASGHAPGPVGLLERPPGPETASLLAALEPANLTSADLLDLLVGYERLVAWAQARQLDAVAELSRRMDPARPEDPERLRPGEPTGRERVVTEVACALTVSSGSAQWKVGLAVSVADRLPWVSDALRQGSIDLARARLLVDETSHLDESQAAGVVLKLLSRAGRLTLAQLRARVRAAVLGIDPETAARRAHRARADREVYLLPHRDGMATLGALLPEADAANAYSQIDQAARALVQADRALGEPPVRTLAQARADVLVDLLHGRGLPSCLGGRAEPSGPATTLTITVGLETLFGDVPAGHAEIAGLGPVTPESARQAAMDALRRMAGGRVAVRWIALTPQGRACAVTGSSYTAAPMLRALLAARDRTCRFPGCSRPAEGCDCDHITPFPRGDTSDANTCSLCRSHHRLKTHAGWRITHGPDGALRWTSPLGRSYQTHPGQWAPPPEAPPGSDLDFEPIPADPALGWAEDEYLAWRAARQEHLDDEPCWPEASGPGLPAHWWWSLALCDW